MTSAAPAASKPTLDRGEKAKTAGTEGAAATGKGRHQAVNGTVEGNDSTRSRPLRRLQEGEAFILDINAGDRQCLMYAKANR